MLVATRDPSHHSGAAPAADSGPGITRLMNVLQVAGALLAIPAGLASAYSIYHANFSVESRCQSLRVNIVSMLDKSADASTLRMLVGHDVTAFEQSCGAVDPDAVAAFKRLLSADRPVPAPAMAQAAPAKPAVEPVKPVAEAKSVQHAAVSSDAKWLDAVRGALVSHHADEPQPVEPTEAARLVAPPAPPSTPPLPMIATPIMPTSPTATATLPVAVVPPAAADHPVPPALIPQAPPLEARAGARLGALVTHLPFMRGLFER